MELTPRSWLLKPGDLAHFANHRQDANACVACVQAVGCCAAIAVVLPVLAVDITRHAVRVTELISPEPWELVTPLAEGVEDVTARVLQRV